MKRFLLINGFVAIGVGILVWLAGGMKGPGAAQTEPALDLDATATTPQERFLTAPDLPTRVHGFEGTSLPAPPEPLRFTDPSSGESVLIADFLRYFLKVARGTPAESQHAGRQALDAEDVELITWREPKTIEEARALADSAEGIRDRLIKWRVTAPLARADGVGLGSLDAQGGGPETVIELDGGVLMVDREHHLVIEGQTIEIFPYLDKARSPGAIVIRHDAFELQGEGLELEQDEQSTRVVIPKDAIVQLYGDVTGPDGSSLLDLGTREFFPGVLSAEDGAVLVHEILPGDRGERMTLELNRRVHAEQVGGRTLDTERIWLTAYLKKGQSEDGALPAKDRWHVERFEAHDGVNIVYPGTTDDGTPFLLSASSRVLTRETSANGTSTTLMEGSPEFTFGGDVPLEGLSRLQTPGFMRASASEQASLMPAPAADIPPGEDPARYQRLILTGNARLVTRGVGTDPAEDTLEGDQMTILLKEIEEEVPADDPEEPPRTRRRIIAVSFAVLGDVRVGGTRMSGMTRRLTAEGLDTDRPVILVEGEGTSFAFHGFRQGERLMGAEEPGRSSAPPSGDADGPAVAPKPEWVLQRLVARDSVRVETSLGGAAVGLPARIEGAELAYDRISDTARIQGSAGRPARLTVASTSEERHELNARTMRFSRSRGEVEAKGTVRGAVFLASDARSASDGRNLPIPEQQLSTPATLGVATNGRILIRTWLAGRGLGPRRDVEQVIRIEGDLVAEMTSASLEVDSLRAKWLEVALVETLPPESEGEASAPSARIGPARSTTSSAASDSDPRGAPATTVGAATRWDVETEQLTARFDARGFESLEAAGRVRLHGEEGEVRGRSLHYEARTRRLVVRGTTENPAWASFGPVEERNELLAHALGLRLGEDGPDLLVARGPAVATLIRRDPDAPGSIERFLVRCKSNVRMTATRLETADLVEVLRQVRSAPGTGWESPFRLWARHVVVHGTDLLSEKAAQVGTVIASGPDTHLRTGEGADETRVWGERFELDVTSSRATLSGSPREDLRIERGPEDDPQAVSDQSRVVIDLDTGTVYDWEGLRVILRGGR